jgi:hypothetical protein
MRSAATTLECDRPTFRVCDPHLWDITCTMLCSAKVLLGNPHVRIKMSALVPNCALMLTSFSEGGFDLTAEGVLDEFVTIIVNLFTDVALEVHLLTVLAVAIGCATYRHEIFLGRLFQEYIDIAFNLLSGRPINLAILLEAFLVLFGLVFNLKATFPALVVESVTVAPMATIVLAVSRLTFCLHAITLCILLEVLAV